MCREFLKKTMIKILNLLSASFLILSIFACSAKNDSEKIEEKGLNVQTLYKNTFKIDTLKRNEQIVYNVTRDTLIDHFKISVTNKNIYEKYIYQDFYLTDSIVVRNYYPQMESTIKIARDNAVIFNQSFLKKDFPKGNFYEFINKATIKDFRFESLNEENNDLIFVGILSIPNTDFENDFHLIISENGKSKFEWIDYESED